MLKTRQKGHLMALFCVLVWGSTFVISKGLMAFLQPLQLMLLRFTLAYIALWLVHPHWYFKWREEWRFLLMALFANTLYCWAENTALTLTQASNVSILVTTSPLVTALILAVFCKEKLSLRQTFSFGVAFVGVVLVVFNGAFALHLNPMGDLLALLAAVSWSAYSMLLRRWSESYPSVLITRKLMFYGILTVLPMVIASGKPIDFASLFVPVNFAKLCYLGLLGSATCYMLWSSAVAKIGVLSANMYVNMVPLVTLVVSALVLGEKITFVGFVGIVLIIFGMIFASVKEKNGE